MKNRSTLQQDSIKQRHIQQWTTRKTPTAVSELLAVNSRASGQHPQRIKCAITLGLRRLKLRTKRRILSPQNRKLAFGAKTFIVLRKRLSRHLEKFNPLVESGNRLTKQTLRQCLARHQDLRFISSDVMTIGPALQLRDPSLYRTIGLTKELHQLILGKPSLIGHGPIVADKVDTALSTLSTIKAQIG